MALLSSLLGSTFKGDASTVPGPTGPIGLTGPTGPTGPGLPIGGNTYQVLQKLSTTDYDYTWKSKTNFPGESYVETMTLSAAPGSAITFDTLLNSGIYYSSNTTANIALNIRGSSTVPIDSILTVGQTTTFIIMLTNGATAYAINSFQVDGVTVTPKWLGGTAPIGVPNAIEVYNFTIIKTATSTYTILAGASKFV